MKRPALSTTGNLGCAVPSGQGRSGLRTAPDVTLPLPVQDRPVEDRPVGAHTERTPVTQPRRVAIANSRAPKSKKLAETVAHQIELEILHRGWPVGESIGSEPELLAQFGVSRSVFREAVRLLEHDGIARMRQGPGGGLFITAPDADGVTRSAALLLEYEHVPVRALIEARITLESATVVDVVERIDDDGIRMLQEALEEESRLQADAPSFLFQALHRRIARLTGNIALELFVDVLVSLTGAHSIGTDALFDPNTHSPWPGDVTTQTHEAHRGIVDAIVARDAELARTRMVEHLREMAYFME